MNMSPDSPGLGNNDFVTESIKVMQEFATVTKEVIETGKVRVVKTVSEETVDINVPIVNESYEVKHIQVPHSILDEPPVTITQQGETTIIKVVREISVVVKKYEVVEEIHITRHLTNTPLTHEITLRKENVHIDRIHNE